MPKTEMIQPEKSSRARCRLAVGLQEWQSNGGLFAIQPGSCFMRARFLFIVPAVCAVLAGGLSHGQAIPAFPGAEGAGAFSTGGRGGDVYYVTSLADTNTPGTLRYGINNAPSSGRTILFKTGGTIYLDSTLGISKSKITIAGQSAPGDGITLAHRTTTVSNNSNVVMRNVRFRPGNSVTLANFGTANAYEPDGIWVTNANDIMIDHVSASWSVDEVLSVTNATDVSVQWSSITEALNNAGHSKGAHGYGSLISGDAISYHHNYYAHNNSRNPRPGLSVTGNYVTGTMNFDFRNNVIYDWGGENGYNGGEAGVMNMNYVGNYAVAGPSTSSSKTGRAFLVGATDTRIYLDSNKIDSDRDQLRDGTNTGWSMITANSASNPTRAAAPVGNTTFVSTQSADAAYASVIAYSGARYWNRDPVDTRVYGEVGTQGGRIINSETDVGGYPLLAAGVAPTDTDGDGMPDAWERSLGLNPAVKNNNGDFDADGYTDLEEYLNELAAWPAPLPAVFVGGTGRFALSTTWDTRWQPSRFDTAQINSGTVTIDAIGQVAGTVQLGATVVAGQTPTLAVSSGWLHLADHLIIGSSTGASARVTLTSGTLILGGTLGVGSASSGLFSFTGGTLVAAAIDARKLKGVSTDAIGSLHVSGAGTFAPGDRGIAGKTSITGGLALDGGTLAIDLGGLASATGFQSVTAASDIVTTTGDVVLGGALDLATIGGYLPGWLVPHTVLSARSVSGEFTSITGMDVGGGRRLAVTTTGTSVVVTAAAAGDINLDGSIDILDIAGFVSAGQFDGGFGAGWASGDFNGDGLVDVLDASEFLTGGLFESGPYAVVGQMATVPEPGGMAMLAMGTATACVALCRRHRHRAERPQRP